MAIRFAGSAGIKSAALTTQALPWTVGFWYYPVTIAIDDCMYAMTATASDIVWEIIHNSATAGDLTWDYWNGTGTAGPMTITGAFTAGAWHYIIARNIAAANRRMSLLKPSGQVAHANVTVSVTPGTLVKHTIGYYETNAAGQWIDGRIAEWFFAAADIQPGGAQLADETVRTLAYNGPWAIPTLAPFIHEYRSFKVPSLANEPLDDNVFQLRNQSGAWVYNGTPSIAQHPPLLEPYDRVTPVGVRSILV